MTDVHSKETRSYNMSRIRAKNTRPEILVRKYLFSQGFRFRLHSKDLPGKPDIILPRYNTVIFVHGCFWHGHQGCKYYVIPKTRTQWWIDKINYNINNDTKNAELLKEKEWKVIVIWECELKKDKQEQTLTRLSEQIRTENDTNN